MLVRLVRRAASPALRPAACHFATSQSVLVSQQETSSPPAPPSVPPSSPPPPPPPPLRRAAWPLAAAVALTASLGGVYYMRRSREERQVSVTSSEENDREPPPRPGSAADLPDSVQYVLVGAGTASFSALRSIRTLHPGADVLLVGEEPAPPYMRPPLSKEVWREPELSADPARVSFRQWSGRRRGLLYEEPEFYSEGAQLARGWRAVKLEPTRRRVLLQAVSRPTETKWVRYGQLLLATGAAPRPLPELDAVRAEGRVMPLHNAADAARLARRLADPDVRRVLVVGGGFLATELAASLAERVSGTDKRVSVLCREGGVLDEVLPEYLRRAARGHLERCGVEVLAGAELRGSGHGTSGALELRLADGARVHADLVVEAAGATVERGELLAEEAGLEVGPRGTGGVAVNAELAARSGVYVAGDLACYHDVLLGRRRVAHHDHAVRSGRVAGHNMAAALLATLPDPPAPPPDPALYDHQTMFWSDLGPRLGYEAVGIVDSSLPTVGVFADLEELLEERTRVAGAEGEGAEEGATTWELLETEREQLSRPAGAGGEEDESRRFVRGVVFYLRQARVVGVLLWNLPDRLQLARQVLEQGEFEDLNEVAKLFTLYDMS